ncbi:MAG: hypothetical protein IJC61_00980 [Oscillospiraceae bacterium]|nr:hypothetical protein [Oscillospiraceae bacterium]
MAVFDFDGTAHREAGAVFDFDGTTNHQIGKVYDWDGMANHLIYSAEEQVFPGTAGLTYTNSSKCSAAATASSLYCETNNSNGGSAKCAVAVDMSSFKSMTIQYTITSGRWNFVKVGVSAYPPSEAFQDNLAIKIYDVTDTPTDAVGHTDTIDVSSLNGVYYVGGFVYSGSSANSVARIDITSIILE